MDNEMYEAALTVAAGKTVVEAVAPTRAVEYQFRMAGPQYEPYTLYTSPCCFFFNPLCTLARPIDENSRLSLLLLPTQT
jgi:hypothetical protein